MCESVGVSVRGCVSVSVRGCVSETRYKMMTMLSEASEKYEKNLPIPEYLRRKENLTVVKCAIYRRKF